MADKTPAVIPRFRNWKKADLPFSLRNVLKRKYNGFFVIILTMSLLEFAGNIAVTGKPEFGLMWNIILGSGFLVWLTLRTLKKNARLLNVDGR